MPLLSVVIPTLNRPDTLRHALATLQVQAAGDCEFIIQNNGGNAEIAALVAALDDPRFKHFTTPEIVTMTENWEMALDRATGDYVTFIGDDDGLMPDACAIATEIFKHGDLELLSWAPFAYYWPDYYHPGFRNRLVASINLRFTAERIDSRDELAQFYGFQTHYARLPMIYNSFVHRDVIDRMKAAEGRYFLGLSPDVTSGIVNAALTRSFVRLSRPLSLSGLSRHSTGHTTFFRETDALGSPRGRRDFGSITKDARLPDLNTLPLFLANDMLLVQRRLFPTDSGVSVSFQGLAQAIATDINDRPEIYDRTLQSVRDLAALHDLDLGAIVVPARLPGRPALGTGLTIQGPERVQFRLDGAALGLRSVADAVRVIAQFVPRGDALDPAILPALMRSPVLTEDGLDFARAGNGAGALVEGWSEAESWGVWSVAKQCRLRFKIDPVPTAPVSVEVTCRGFVHARHPRLQVSCRIGTTAPQEWEFSVSSARGCRKLRIEPDAVAPDGEVTVTLTLNNPRSPAELGLAADVRPLGIGVECMWIAG